jgi:hypothetical protein
MPAPLGRAHGEVLLRLPTLSLPFSPFFSPINPSWQPWLFLRLDLIWEVGCCLLLLVFPEFFSRGLATVVAVLPLLLMAVGRLSSSTAGWAAVLQPPWWRPSLEPSAGARHRFALKWFVPGDVVVAGGCGSASATRYFRASSQTSAWPAP